MTDNEAKKFFDDGLEHYDNGRYDEAINCWEKIPVSNKNYYNAQWNLSLVYNKKGDYDKAIECWEKIPVGNENYYTAQYNLGVTYNKKGDYDKAIECWEKISVGNENYYTAQYNLGVTYDNKGKHDKAIECWEKIPVGDKNYYNAQWSLGLIYTKKGDNDKAIEYWEKISVGNENYYNAQFILGLFYSKKADNSKAIEYWEKISVGNEYYYDAQYGLGLSYSKKRDYDKAIECWEKIPKENENYYNAQYGLGIAYYEKGDNDKAIEYWEKISVGNENYFNAQYCLGIAYGNKGDNNKGDNNKAIECLSNVPKDNENYYKAQHGIGLVYGKKGDNDKKIEYFKKYTNIILEEGISEFESLLTIYNSNQKYKFYTDEQFLEYKKKILLKEQKNNKSTLEQFIKEPLHNNIRPTSKGEKQYILYQYMRCSKETLYRIKNNYLAFTNPRNFNDPYDPLIKVLEKTTDDKTALLETLDFRIACLSKNPKNILMWSHYAAKHTGVCVAYNVTALIDEAEMVFKKIDFRDSIQIQKDSYILDIGNIATTTILDTFTIKHEDWAYEKEYRFIKISDDKKEVVPIVKIYLGKHISSENEELVRHIVDNKAIENGEKKIKISKFNFGDKNVFELK